VLLSRRNSGATAAHLPFPPLPAASAEPQRPPVGPASRLPRESLPPLDLKENGG
jgi:hypothetical protein